MVLAGLSCGLIGVFLVGLRSSFLAVGLSHAGLAGAIIGILLNQDPFLWSLTLCLLFSLFIVPLSRKSHIGFDASIGVFFSVFLGIGFLLLGLISQRKNEALNYLWGSALMLGLKDIAFMAVNLLVIIFFMGVFYRKLKISMISEELARSMGIPAVLIFTLVFLVSSLTVSVNLNTVGGLLIFALIVNPASCAFRISSRFRSLFFVSSLIGAGSGFAGWFFSLLFNLPLGASVVIVSSLALLLCLICKRS